MGLPVEYSSLERHNGQASDGDGEWATRPEPRQWGGREICGSRESTDRIPRSIEQWAMCDWALEGWKGGRVELEWNWSRRLCSTSDAALDYPYHSRDKTSKIPKAPFSVFPSDFIRYRHGEKRNRWRRPMGEDRKCIKRLPPPQGLSDFASLKPAVGGSSRKVLGILIRGLLSPSTE